jgi:hypothetical protein
VGIDYGKVEQPQAVKEAYPVKPEPAPKPTRERHGDASPGAKPSPRVKPVAPPPPPSEPKLHRFRITIRCTVVVEVIREEEAQTSKQARERALKEVADGQMDFSKAEVTRRVVRVEKL